MQGRDQSQKTVGVNAEGRWRTLFEAGELDGGEFEEGGASQEEAGENGCYAD